MTKKNISKKTKLNVLPKSDVFLIRTNEKLTGFLKERNNYLEECDLRNLRSSGFIYENVSGSGISVKLVDSTSYQIHKFTVRSFLKVFNDPYLGAGAMLYSKHEKDFLKIDNHKFYKTIKEQSIKDKLLKLTTEAFEKEVFGAPTFIVNNKIFWGQDRLEYALEELKN